MPVRAWDAVVNDNEPGSVQKPTPRESQIGVHIQLRWFAVENLLLCWERREFSRSRSIFLEGDSSDRAGTRAIPPNTRTISNTNSKKFMIALRCLLDESDQCVRSAASLKSDTTMIGATSDLFLADCDQHHRSEFYALSMRLEQINHRREWE